ncbi:hypothetical protein BCR35DRAFT_301262 [Leucosporidium creatinivorum]|uniref:Ubiquitin-like domain-containing protein n=1 Tax=Leucosporidium creatinivorum TaxID=106004 RepID=A0A1Y2FXZ4_9BASI|nr:hypothetical protein BCR35DRAFT_301262 [Leucosporidium creatinivorum]
MQLFVRSLEGRSLPIDASSLDTLRFAVADRTGIPMEEQRLIFGGRQMESGSLESYGVHDGVTVGLALRLRGGEKKKRCNCFITTTDRCSQASLRIVGDCSYCTKSFCGTHRLPEDHKCPNLQSCKQEAFDKLKSRLEGEQTVTEKIKSF